MFNPVALGARGQGLPLPPGARRRGRRSQREDRGGEGTGCGRCSPSPHRGPTGATSVGPREPPSLLDSETLRRAPGGVLGYREAAKHQPEAGGRCGKRPLLSSIPQVCLLPQMEQDVFNGGQVLTGFYPFSAGRGISAARPEAKKREKRAIFIGDVRAYVGIHAQHRSSSFFFSPEITLPCSS